MAYTTMAVMGQNAGLSMPVQDVGGLKMPVVYMHDTAGVVSTWSYAPPAGGLTNTTAVTIAAAPGVGLKNYITSLQIASSAAIAVTEIVLRDGAGGAVIWRAWVAALMLPVSIVFGTPLHGSDNNQIDLAEASLAAGVLVSAQGYVAP